MVLRTESSPLLARPTPQLKVEPWPCARLASPPLLWGPCRLHRRPSLLSKNRFPSQMAHRWILPEHLVPPTAHSREEGLCGPC